MTDNRSPRPWPWLWWDVAGGVVTFAVLIVLGQHVLVQATVVVAWLVYPIVRSRSVVAERSVSLTAAPEVVRVLAMTVGLIGLAMLLGATSPFADGRKPVLVVPGAVLAGIGLTVLVVLVVLRNRRRVAAEIARYEAEQREQESDGSRP